MKVSVSPRTYDITGLTQDQFNYVLHVVGEGTGKTERDAKVPAGTGAAIYDALTEDDNL